MRRPPIEENVEALKRSVASLRKAAGDGKGPGAVASRRLADALSKLAERDQATRDKAQNIFVAPHEDRVRPAQEHDAGRACHV